MSALELSDQEAGAVAVAPRVTLADIEDKISGEYFFTGAQAAAGCPILPALKCLTICILVMKNGFTVTGESACASPENFNEELGRKFAREQALRKVWAFEGYLLREQLSNS